MTLHSLVIFVEGAGQPIRLLFKSFDRAQSARAAFDKDCLLSIQGDAIERVPERIEITDDFGLTFAGYGLIQAAIISDLAEDLVGQTEIALLQQKAQAEAGRRARTQLPAQVIMTGVPGRQ